jgi:hypothetical protein
MDYEIINSEVTDQLFKGDTTYWITDYVVFYGTTTFEGGTVIKFAHTNWAALDIRGDVVCETDAYRPAIFTVQRDNTVGETVDTTAGTTNFFSALNIGSNPELKHIRISYARYALHTFGFRLSHAQFLHCDTALLTEYAVAQMDNVLMYDIGTNFQGISYQVKATHMTLHQCGTLTADLYYPAYSTVALTNSLLVGVTNAGDVVVTTNTTVSPADDGTVFQTVGAGAHYLAANSPYRNAGTTNGLSSTLLADLKKRTTYPPVIVNGFGSYFNDVTFSPQAQRDTDLPDLGYH